MSDALDNYVKGKRALFDGKVVPKGIRDRWAERIVEKGLLDKGIAGAIEYLSHESQEAIGENKCVQFARQAENSGNYGFSLPFWRKAFQRKVGFEPLSTEKVSFKDAEGNETTLSMDSEMVEEKQAAEKEVKEKLKDFDEIRKETIKIDPNLPLAKIGTKIRVLIANKIIKYENAEQREVKEPSGTIHGTFLALSKIHSKLVIDGLILYKDLFDKYHPTYFAAAQSNLKDNRKYYYEPIVKMMINKVLYLDKDYSQDQKESVMQAIALTDFIKENFSKEVFSTR